MILLCFGTRPEWLKIKPLTKVLDNYKLLFTGQHPDLLSDIDVDFKITVNENNNRLDQVVSDCLIQFPQDNFDSILVQGDTASAFACALAGFHRRTKICYLEAGLRSYNLNHPFPEEGYRQMIARLADINFCPTQLSKENLISEKVKGECYVVGNTCLDNLLLHKNNCKYENKVLVTLHRRENHQEAKDWFYSIDCLAQRHPNIEFILPIHPNPNITKHKSLLKHVKVVDPLTHENLLSILTTCKLVITDSGGIQEESSFLNKKVIVCRQTTERPEGIYTGHLHMCKKPTELEKTFNDLIANFYISVPCPYGDGNSSQKIKIILNNIK